MVFKEKKKGYHLTPASVSPLAGHTWHICLYTLAQSSQPESSHEENKRKPERGSSVFYKTERTTSSNTNLALKKHWRLFYIDKTKEVAGHRARHASAHLQSQHLGTEAEGLSQVPGRPGIHGDHVSNKQKEQTANYQMNCGNSE